MFSKYLGWGGPLPEEDKEAVRALPASWYTSEEMYQLERRGIFSRRWQIITHASRLKESGDWLRFDTAGFNFMIVKDREGKIQAFHNVCRHRAYPVVVENKGTSKILACRYHGWSYGLNGKLAKAPGYQDLPSFDKSQNGLFPIHTHVDQNGFIWINLDSKDTPEVSWNEEFEGVDTQERFKQFNFWDYELDHIWEFNADYNWKIAADNFNECYHCATTHPDVPDFIDLNAYGISVKASHMQHDAATTEEQMKQGLGINSTYYYPNASMTISPHFFFMQRFVPTGPTTTNIIYQVWRNKNSSEENFQRINQMYKRVMLEDKELCNLAQKNLNAGIFVNGEMHPVMEKGPLYFQSVTRRVIHEHFEKEREAKKEIWPAKQRLPTSAKVSNADVELCSGLACSAGQEQLVW